MKEWADMSVIRIKRFFKKVILFPILPFIMWGPFTHPYIARKTLEKAEENRDKARVKEFLEALIKNKEYYISAANAPDCISADNILYKRIIYDYAHNYLPDRTGYPVFGYRLVDTILKKLKATDNIQRKEKLERDLAFACGWLNHQLADYVPHYKEADGFHGYANSHQIIGASFYPDILRKKESVEHFIIELFHDINISENLDREFAAAGRIMVKMPAGKRNIVTEISKSFREFANIPYQHLPLLQKNFNKIIDGLASLIIILKELQPQLIEEIIEFINDNNHREYLEKSIDYVYENLFLLDYEEIHRRADYGPEKGKGIDYLKIIPVRQESILLKLAYKLGELFTAESISSLLREGMIFQTKILWKKIEVQFKSDILDRLKPLLLNIAEDISTRSEEARSIKNYLFVLLKKERDILSAARDAFCTGLRPIAQLDVDEEEIKRKEPEQILKEMLENRLIKIRFTTAIRKDRKTDR